MIPFFIIIIINYIKNYPNEDEFFSDYNDEYAKNENEFLKEFFNKLEEDSQIENKNDNNKNNNNFEDIV